MKINNKGTDVVKKAVVAVEEFDKRFFDKLGDFRDKFNDNLHLLLIS